MHESCIYIIALECYDFSPKDVLDAITIQDYLVFLTYTLEYRALVMEQMSHQQEQQYLMSHPDPANRVDGYGVVLLDFTIRDLKGMLPYHVFPYYIVTIASINFEWLL